MTLPLPNAISNVIDFNYLKGITHLWSAPLPIPIPCMAGLRVYIDFAYII